MEQEHQRNHPHALVHAEHFAGDKALVGVEQGVKNRRPHEEKQHRREQPEVVGQSGGGLGVIGRRQQPRDSRRQHKHDGHNARRDEGKHLQHIEGKAL